MPRGHGDDDVLETVPSDAILTLFDAVDGPVLLPADVVNEFGWTQETARREVHHRHERGNRNRRTVSRQVSAWCQAVSPEPMTDNSDESTDDCTEGGSEVSLGTLRGTGANLLVDHWTNDAESDRFTL